MAQMRNVEKRIFDMEGFEVRIKDVNGRRLRPTDSLNMYSCCERMAKNTWTVQEWKNERFTRDYPDHQVDVMDGKGAIARGNTTLARVRDTYSEE